MTRLVDPQNIGELNKQTTRKIDALRKELASLRDLVKQIHVQVKLTDAKHAPLTTNNLTFTWTGSGGVISWNAGAIVSKNSINVPVAAGSISGLAATTRYWMAYNKAQNQMIATVTAPLQNANNIVLCQVLTLGGASNGTIGGGGSTGGFDLSGVRY